jgi:amino acid adenylation domain-containing protein
MKLSDFRQVESGLSELRELLARFNATARPYPRDETVHGLFAKQASQRPDAVALIHGEREYTYRQLDEASNRFARFLIDHGLKHEELVAVILERPFEMIVAMLGVLKAGGAYVPIDQATPSARIRSLLDGCGARVLVCEKRHMRLINRLQWECPRLEMLFCADSYDVRGEPEEGGEYLKETMWDHVGATAVDDISAGGWASIYTGEWLSREVMDAYGDNIRDKLLPYLNETTRVLEIGCSSGLSLVRIAPLVGFYYGTDISQRILDWTANEIAGRNWPHVRLRRCPANETDRIEETEFDIVVINGVIRFFSGHNHLRDVLRKAIGRMARRGVMFLGNLWDDDHKDRLMYSLHAFGSAHGGRGHRTKFDLADDLFVSRDFLDDLRHEFPEIRAIECSAMRGTAVSELSEYGYDAILHVDRSAADSAVTSPRKKFQYDLKALDEYPATAVAERNRAEGLAYVMHTSGTSGKPKGVMVEHRAIVRLVVNTDYLQLGPQDRVLQTGSVAFDASTFEIWGPLLSGGGLCRPTDRAILDPAEVARLIATHRITTMFVTTSLFNLYVDSDINMFAGLKHLLTGGERASPYHFNKVRERYAQLALGHVYGPTENTTFTTHCRIERSYAGDVPIGRPIANTEVLILDARGVPVPVGVPGEICTAGDGLARGYLNDPELTRQKFVPHPFSPGARIYRTGDSGLWRADGTIEYLGRLDGQVKIRGYRIEPAEIEHHILRHARIKQTLVLAKEIDGLRELVAYVTVKDGGGEGVAAELREWLSRSLPDYMVPSHIVWLKKMPLNTNGKVDRTVLPDPVAASRPTAARYEPAATETEQDILAIWEEVLGRSQFGVTDNFFDQGGHSLRITKALSLIEHRLGVVVPLTAFFTHPTVRQLASYIIDGAKFGVRDIDDAMVPLSVAGAGPNLFAFPPGTGDALGFTQVAPVLPCRFYGFNFIEADSRLRDYADLIARIDPDGPYLLFGYSSGGNLAYHVARELEQRGGRVAAIIMVDAARRLHPMPMSEAEIAAIANRFLSDASVRPYLSSPILRNKAQRLVRSSLTCVGNMVDYHCVNADIHLLTSENGLVVYRDDAGKPLVSQSGWADATAGRFCVYDGFGHHNHMLMHPHLDRNADVVRKILDRMIRSTTTRNDEIASRRSQAARRELGARR